MASHERRPSPAGVPAGDPGRRPAWERLKRAALGDRLRVHDTLRDQIVALIKCRHPKTSLHAACARRGGRSPPARAAGRRDRRLGLLSRGAQAAVRRAGRGRLRRAPDQPQPIQDHRGRAAAAAAEGGRRRRAVGGRADGGDDGGGAHLRRAAPGGLRRPGAEQPESAAARASSISGRTRPCSRPAASRRSIRS